VKSNRVAIATLLRVPVRGFFYFIGSYIKVFTSKLSGLSSDGANRHYVALFQRSVDE